MMDSWQKWRIVCLLILSVEDVEDVYTIGYLITGFLLFGVGGYLAYREIRKTSAAVLAIVRLPGMYDGICRINTQTEMLLITGALWRANLAAPLRRLLAELGGTRSERRPGHCVIENWTD
ncbi:hypothetical protein CRENBAI_022314 [Crenichthys baileyi]|uniref:Uncharacterized protein n=1 Tax=Crenichthys baileyi TaxID=28760 RepID=A0AAV9S3L9_9TELE